MGDDLFCQRDTATASDIFHQALKDVAWQLAQINADYAVVSRWFYAGIRSGENCPQRMDRICGDLLRRHGELDLLSGRQSFSTLLHLLQRLCIPYDEVFY
jgi:hypothetical protein